MDVWRELINTALLGTERRQLTPELRQALARQGLDAELPAAQLLLEGAAVFHQLKRGAGSLEVFQGNLPEPPAIQGTRPVDPRSAYHLQLILSGRYLPALEEYVAGISGQEKVLPPESLPALLDRCLDDDGLWQALRPIVGETGRWLVSLNTRWRSLFADPDPGRWAGGSREERQAQLLVLRRLQPAEGRKLLRDSWPALPFRDRAVLLDALRPGLSSDDEDFLEEALADRRKEVRRIAAELLLLVPGSRFSEHLYHWASAFIGEDLAIALPSEPADEFVAVGLQEGPTPGTRISLRTGWLVQVLAYLAPARWEQQLGLTPLGILRLAAGHKDGQALISAWMEATLRFNDHRWMGALLALWQENGADDILQNKVARQLMEKMPDQLVNRFVINQLERKGPLVMENTLTGQLLLLGKHWWSDQLTLIIVKGFQSWLSESKVHSWGVWHYKQLLEIAAFRSKPGLLLSLRKGWDVGSPLWPRWEGEVDRFLDILRFRKEMREAITGS